MRVVSMVGRKCGRLTVTSRAPKTAGNGDIKWMCRCICGKSCVVRGYLLRTGHTKSCGCYLREVMAKVGRELGPTRVKAGTAERALFYEYRYSAKKRHLEFALNEQEFRQLTLGDCYYCGSKPFLKSFRKDRPHHHEIIANGLDRIDNSGGYTLVNTVSCCRMCNLAKSDFGQKEFIDWAIRVASVAGRRT